MHAVNKVTQGHNRSIKSALLGWSGEVSEAAVFTRLFQHHHTKHQTSRNIFVYLSDKLYVNDQTSILLWIALRCSSRDTSLSSHVAF